VLRVLGAGVPALVAAGALTGCFPAPARGTATVSGSTVTFDGAPGARNVITFSRPGDEFIITDATGPLTAGAGCRNLASDTVACFAGFIDLRLGDGNDLATNASPRPSRMNGGPGNDGLFGGPTTDDLTGEDGVDILDGGEGQDTLREASTPAIGDVLDVDAFDGGSGIDTVAYDGTIGVTADLDGTSDDGQPGEGDLVNFTVEQLVGTDAEDVLTGDAGNNFLNGRGGSDLLTAEAGDDVYQGGPGDDRMQEATTAPRADVLDADTYLGGVGVDLVSYALSTAAVNVSIDDTANDGRVNEGDDVTTDMENVITAARAVVVIGDGDAIVLNGGGGVDLMRGGGGPDFVGGGDGDDTLLGEDGDDTVSGGAGFDVLGGGAGTDVCLVGPDSGSISECESTGPQVGEVQGTPRHLNARAGDPASLAVTWTHPVAWRQLDELEVRLVADDGRLLFEVTWDQETDQLVQTGGGGVSLVAEGSAAAALNVQKIRLELQLEIAPWLAGTNAVVEGQAVDDVGQLQPWEAIGTVAVRAG
jgi:Ca2+-binding RTX toxin-like protein